MANEGQDLKTSATVRHEVQLFSMLKETSLGPISYVRGLPWRIRVAPISFGGVKYCGFYLECIWEDLLCTWSCKVKAELRLVSHLKHGPVFSRDFDALFSAIKDIHGCNCFMNWEDICNPMLGFIKDDVVIFEVSVNAEEPYGVTEKRGRFQHHLQELTAAALSNPDATSSRTAFARLVDPAAANANQSDVTLVCQDGSFLCHREILARGSSVFSSMFSGGFKESNMHASAEAGDVTSETMRDILRFIYCGNIETDITQATSEVQHEFLYAAVKYDLKPLKDLLVIAFEEMLTPSTACRYVIYADRFDLIGLKKSCFTVMAKPDNRLAVYGSPEWDEFIGKKELAGEFYCFGAV